MLKIHPDDTSYTTFSDILTGYRLSSMLMVAHDAGLFDAVGENGVRLGEICRLTGWDRNAADRLVQCLCSLGCLVEKEDRFFLSPFARTFFRSSSNSYQGHTMAFEKRLMDSWDQLEATLTEGHRVYGTQDKSNEELDAAMVTYLGAMGEAATVRSQEMWHCLTPQAQGTILDIGAGTGTFLSTFLCRHPRWKGIFCDLEEVIAKAKKEGGLLSGGERISWCPANFLVPSDPGLVSIIDHSCDLVLLSNVVHCQGAVETAALLKQAAAKTSKKGMLLIHDFFKDLGWRGALYDIHMMLNTYNGRTYTQGEITTSVSAHGMHHAVSLQLPSGSTLIACAFTEEVLQQSMCNLSG